MKLIVAYKSIKVSYKSIKSLINQYGFILFFKKTYLFIKRNRKNPSKFKLSMFILKPKFSKCIVEE
mgnify:CR=1 FL=1